MTIIILAEKPNFKTKFTKYFVKCLIFFKKNGKYQKTFRMLLLKMNYGLYIMSRSFVLILLLAISNYFADMFTVQHLRLHGINSYFMYSFFVYV